MVSNDEEVDVSSLSSAGIGSLDNVGLLGTGMQLLKPFRLDDDKDPVAVVCGASKIRIFTEGNSLGGAKQDSIIVGLTL